MRGGVLRSKFVHTYNDIISVENLLCAWQEFLRGKRKRADVQEFNLRLMDNIMSLYRDLLAGTYRHGGYEHFVVTDPKRRDIHKASVRDRLVHHAIYRVLYPHFDKRFIPDSYSCRNYKGTHKAIQQFERFARKVSNNHTCPVYVLKCDIRKFFATIDHSILCGILERYISDKNILTLLQNIISSFHSNALGKGLPLGNLTSQLLVNIYLNEFDQYMKKERKTMYYIRYADDFVVLSPFERDLKELVQHMKIFLGQKLALTMHPQKVSLRTVSSGVDFLGWVQFPKHRVLRAVTRRRMVKRVVSAKGRESTRRSYLGLLQWGNAHALSEVLRNTGS